jgi:hypothetical protein
MSKPLKLMIYDNTDVKFSVGQLKYAMPNDFLEKFGIDLDDIDLEFPVGLTHSWFAGGMIYRLLRWVDEIKGFSSWESALEWLSTHKPEQEIAQIQVWGHGSPGKTWMNGEPLHNNSFNGKHADALKKVADRLTDDGTIWFRNCSVFCGDPGHSFAKVWSTQMDCRIAAHTYIISPFQSGLHTIRPGEEPSWTREEGIQTGTPEHPRQIKNSSFGEPNTIFMIRSAIPEGW